MPAWFVQVRLSSTFVPPNGQSHVPREHVSSRAERANASGVEGSPSRRMAAGRLQVPRHEPRADSPESHVERARPADQTVHPATTSAPNCAPDDNERPETAPGCRRMHSLSRGVSPDAQFGAPVVAGASVWLARTDRFDRRRQLALQTRRQATAGRQTRRLATARSRYLLLPVAGASVWLAHCRQDVSLAREDGQIRPAATAGLQTRRLATASTRLCLLPVAGASVWLAHCRQDVSLAHRLSPDAQSGSRTVAGCTVWSARCRQARSPTKGPRFSLGFH